MGRWPVTTNGEDEPLFTAESIDGLVSLHIPSPDPVLMSVEKAEQIRQAIGAAIGSAQAGNDAIADSPTGNNPPSQHEDTESHRGEDSV